VFGRLPNERDFQIVDQRGSVHREAGNVTAPEKIGNHRRHAYLDHVTADPPKDGSPSAVSGRHTIDDFPQILGRKHPRQRIDECADRSAAPPRAAELPHVHLAGKLG
jgi:hypothetical protein